VPARFAREPARFAREPSRFAREPSRLCRGAVQALPGSRPGSARQHTARMAGWRQAGENGIPGVAVKCAIWCRTLATDDKPAPRGGLVGARGGRWQDAQHE
jgi:hypothetical protein